MRIALPVVLLLVTMAPVHADSLRRVRGASDKEIRLIEDLIDRSATGRALVASLEATDLIVYVQLAATEASGRAATRFVTTSGPNRFLRIVLGVMTPAFERIPLLAHELQHALEIANEPGVRDDDGVRELYLRIGEDRWARRSFETTAARETGLRVRREILSPGRRGEQAVPEPAAHVLATSQTGDELSSVHDADEDDWFERKVRCPGGTGSSAVDAACSRTHAPTGTGWSARDR